jgi:hypothetical protein
LVKANPQADLSYDVVVTSDHIINQLVVYGTSTLFFVPEMGKGEPVALRIFRRGNRQTKKHVEDDWMVLKTEVKLSHRDGSLDLSALAERDIQAYLKKGAEILYIGFNAERGEMMVSDNCAVVSKRRGDLYAGNEAALLHDCDILGGGSGGPLIIKYNEKYFVIGIQSVQFQRTADAYEQSLDPRRNPNVATALKGKAIESILEAAQYPFKQIVSNRQRVAVE